MQKFRLKWLVPMVAFAVFASSSVALASGGGETSGGGGGGGGSTNTIPQVAGTWTGFEKWDPSLAIYALQDVPLSFTLTEDAAGNLAGSDNRMSIPIVGKVSTNGSVVIQDGTYYGTTINVNVSPSITCADGSTGQVLTGKFRRKEGFGIITMDNCLVR